VRAVGGEVPLEALEHGFVGGDGGVAGIVNIVAVIVGDDQGVLLVCGGAAVAERPEVGRVAGAGLLAGCGGADGGESRVQGRGVELEGVARGEVLRGGC
jgi:hypothetical protein